MSILTKHYLSTNPIQASTFSISPVLIALTLHYSLLAVKDKRKANAEKMKSKVMKIDKSAFASRWELLKMQVLI